MQTLGGTRSWMDYRQTKEEIDGIFSMFDTDNSDTLDRAQLATVTRIPILRP